MKSVLNFLFLFCRVLSWVTLLSAFFSLFLDGGFCALFLLFKFAVENPDFFVQSSNSVSTNMTNLYLKMMQPVESGYLSGSESSVGSFPEIIQVDPVEKPDSMHTLRSDMGIKGGSSSKCCTKIGNWFSGIFYAVKRFFCG